MSSNDSPASRLATRLAFFIGGFGMSCWAPLVPFAKARLMVGDGLLGLLLLCLGAGSVAAMWIAGLLCAHFGSRPVVGTASVVSALMLPVLAFAPTPISLGLALLLFGAAVGSLDVAMNVHAVEVERASPTPLMSGFHAMYSVGGFAGSAFMTAALSLRLTPLLATLPAMALILAAAGLGWPRLLRTTRPEQRGPLFVMPHGLILIISALASITFLSEGAVLDWGALLITGAGLLPRAQGGLGYMVFSVAMTAGRFGGDRLVARIGDGATLFWGGLLTIAGYAMLLLAPAAALALGGFLLVGLGASNLVPVLFRRAGRQTVMPAALAIAAMTTAGYGGMLVGPALIGFIAHASSLRVAFWLLAGLICLVPATARWISPAARRTRRWPAGTGRRPG